MAVEPLSPWSGVPIRANEKNIFDPDSGDILSWQIEAKRKARKSSDPASKVSDSEKASDAKSSISSLSRSSSNPDPHWEARRILNESSPKNDFEGYLRPHRDERNCTKSRFQVSLCTAEGACQACTRRLMKLTISHKRLALYALPAAGE